MATETSFRIPRRCAPNGPIDVAVVNSCVVTCEGWAEMIEISFEHVTTHEFIDPRLFLQHIQQQPVHLVLLADAMRYRTGQDVLDTIRANGVPMADIPVIMMTLKQRMRTTYLERGADLVIEWPYHLGEVFAEMEPLMNRPIWFP